MRNITVKENQTMLLSILWTGEETELSYSINLAGKGAEIKFLALLLGQQTQNLSLKINVYHKSLGTKSKVIVRSALKDKAQVNFEGLVKIDKGAKGTNAWLAAHILLLSDKAKGKAIPSLEIAENDIKAGHATTVGKLNDLELFYLMSRGLTKQRAKQLIVQGFLQSMLNEFPQKEAAKAQKKLDAFEKN